MGETTLRRSRRGKLQSYMTGDTVEIVKRDGIATGVLLHKVKIPVTKLPTDSPPPVDGSAASLSSPSKRQNPAGVVHWMVDVTIKIPDEAAHETDNIRSTREKNRKEQISENGLGRIISRRNNKQILGASNYEEEEEEVEEQGEATAKVWDSKRKRKKLLENAKLEAATRKAQKSKRRATTTTTNTNEGKSSNLDNDDPIENQTTRKRSTRAATSNLATTSSPSSPVPLSKKIIRNKRKLPVKKRPNKKDGAGLVKKIKLLTGTLILHRGEHRRAEFIRTI